jgi:hypothetical protein
MVKDRDRRDRERLTQPRVEQVSACAQERIKWFGTRDATASRVVGSRRGTWGVQYPQVKHAHVVPRAYLASFADGEKRLTM